VRPILNYQEATDMDANLSPFQIMKFRFFTYEGKNVGNTEIEACNSELK
jgi:hypothetical protein